MSRVYIPQPLRRFVTDRAGGQCEYCLLHQDDVPFTHQIDHIIPLRHGGKTESNNLALACLECNRHKGSDLTGLDPVSDAITPLFNPRSYVWQEHFALEGARILGLTPAGRTTATLLRFNDRVRVVQRRVLIEAGRYPPPQ